VALAMGVGVGLCPFASNGKQIKECLVVVNPLCLGLVATLINDRIFWVLEPQISLSMHTTKYMQLIFGRKKGQLISCIGCRFLNMGLFST